MICPLRLQVKNDLNKDLNVNCIKSLCAWWVDTSKREEGKTPIEIDPILFTKGCAIKLIAEKN